MDRIPKDLRLSECPPLPKGPQCPYLDTRSYLSPLVSCRDPFMELVFNHPPAAMRVSSSRGHPCPLRQRMTLCWRGVTVSGRPHSSLFLVETHGPCLEQDTIGQPPCHQVRRTSRCRAPPGIRLNHQERPQLYDCSPCPFCFPHTCCLDNILWKGITCASRKLP